MYTLVPKKDIENGGGEKRRSRKTVCLYSCGAIILISFLLIIVIIGVISQTSILHTFMRRTVFRDFSINRTIPDYDGDGEMEPWDLSNPQIYGLPRTTENIKIPLGSDKNGPYLGAWYMTPERPVSDRPTVLYLHGIAQTRGYLHRVGLYQMFLETGYPVLAVDYRGFADSTEIEDIHETTVVEDAAVSLDYLRSVKGASAVLVWGHSQGAAIATHMVAQQEEGLDSVKMILESPFNNMDGQISATLSWCLRLVINLVGLEDADLAFRSDIWLPKVKVPVLIIHALDDRKIPPRLSKDLFENAKNEKEDLARIVIDGQCGFGHNDIYKFNNLPNLISQYWHSCTDSNKFPKCISQDYSQC